MAKGQGKDRTRTDVREDGYRVATRQGESWTRVNTSGWTVFTPSATPSPTTSFTNPIFAIASSFALIMGATDCLINRFSSLVSGFFGSSGTSSNDDVEPTIRCDEERDPLCSELFPPTPPLCEL